MKAYGREGRLRGHISYLSRAAATDCSPRRKLWASPQTTAAPKGRKKAKMRTLITLLLLTTSVLAQSPAELAISSARNAIAKKPAQFSGYNQLAVALARRARETSDVNFYAQAEDVLKKSFELAPANIEGEKVKIWLLLGRHEFAAALAEATALNRQVPDDVLVYGFLTDANVELGNYDAAEKSVQWMLNLRPGNLPALTRAAYLRELFGDNEGALELMNMAYQATPSSEAEDGAWILSQLGHLYFASGQLDKAADALQTALIKFPGYHYALGNLAKVRIQEKRHAEAVVLLQQRYKAAPHAENLYDLAEALELAGHHEEAQRAFTEFETKSLAESVRADNSNRELIFYYADHAHEPAKALTVAEKEFARRHDVFTLDAYAWALHVNGRDAEARKQIATALAVGIRDPQMMRHAERLQRSEVDRMQASSSPGSDKTVVGMETRY
jgi:tetratricopeptide (TPR) repeat protein